MRRLVKRFAAYKSVVALGCSVLHSDTASAFNRPNLGDCVNLGPGIEYFLSNAGGVSWDSFRIAAVVAGADSWSNLKAFGAGSALTATRLTTEPSTYSTTQFRVVLSSTASQNTANCSTNPKQIVLRTDESVPIGLQYAAAHEFGHAFGLRHTGYRDNLTDVGSLYGVLGFLPGPLMSGCIRPSGSGFQLPKVDDWASAWHKRSGNQSAAADGGNESSGLSLWQRSESVINDDVWRYAGDRSFRIDNVGSIAQRVRIQAPAASLTFGLRYKHNSSSTSFKGEARVVSVSPGDCGSDSPSYPSGSSWVTLANQPLSVSPSWTGLSVVNASTNWSIYTAIDTHAFVHNLAASTSLWADNIELRN